MTKSKKRPTIQNKHTEVESQDQLDTPIDASTTLTLLHHSTLKMPDGNVTFNSFVADESALQMRKGVKTSDENNTPLSPASIDWQGATSLSTTNSAGDFVTERVCPGDSTIQEIPPSVVVVVERETSSKPIQKKTPAKKSTSSKKGKNGKLSSGLLTTSSTTDERTTMQIANIILHLKCSMADVQSYNEEIHKQMMNPLIYNPSVPPDIMTYHQPKNYSELNNIVTIPTPDQEDFAYKESKDCRKNRIVNDHFLQNKHERDDVPTRDVNRRFGGDETETTYRSTIEDGNHDIIKETGDVETKENQDESIWYNFDAETKQKENFDEDQKDPCVKDIHTKLKKLKISLYKNLAFMDKKSACFWCTYDFDNPECYIPRYEMDGAIHGYGSFCRPECAAAYLMKENLDDSTKFERYHLLNHIYSKIYDYKKNIKPAPNPYYMLDKFYGNLSIQEYRKLLKSDHLLLTIDKPLTRILPELHEDNEEFLTNIYGVQSNTNVGTSITKHGNFKVRRQSDKPTGPTKSNIIKEHFGIK